MLSPPTREWAFPSPQASQSIPPSPSPSCGIIFEMSEDLSIGNWEFTPEDMKTFSEAKLHYVMVQNRSGNYGSWAMAELARRQNERISKLIESLSSSSDRLEGLTNTLKNLTWVLIVLTFVAVVVPIGIEVWNAYRP